MSINFGSNKMGKIYVGGTSIGKVYRGSELVYQSGLGIPAFGAKYNLGSLECYIFLFGGWTSNAICGAIDSNPILKLSGNLGKSGSSVEISDGQNTRTYPYQRTVVYNGIKFFLYYYDITGSGWSNGRYMRILTEESAVGTYAIYPSLNAQWGEPYPINLTANSFTVNMDLLGAYTANRDSSLDFVWDGKCTHVSMNL